MRHFDGYKPAISLQQFFTTGFGELKIILCNEIIAKMRAKHKALGNQRRAPAVRQMDEPAEEEAP